MRIFISYRTIASDAEGVISRVPILELQGIGRKERYMGFDKVPVKEYTLDS